MRTASTRNILAGLIVSLALGMGLTSLVMRAGHDAARIATIESNAVVTSAAVTEVIDEALSSEADVQVVVQELVEAVPGLEQVRVIHAGRRQLTASTNAEDKAAGELPRRLKREQKEWFDQVKELEAAYTTNVDEGKARKREILASVTPDEQLELVLPLFEDGEVKASVQTVNLPLFPSELGRGVGLLGVVLLLGSAVIMLALSRFVPSGLPLFLLGLVLVIAVLWVHAGVGISAIVEDRVVGQESVAERALQVKETIQAVPGVIGESLAITGWNLDQFRQPRDTFDAKGVVATEQVLNDFAVAKGRFVQGAFFLGLISLLFYYWIAAGWAAKTWQALVKYRGAYGFVMPAMVGMILLVFFPFFYGILMSFTNQTLYNVNQPIYELWSGLDNYVKILSDVDVFRTAEDGSRSVNYQSFYWTLGFTILWTVSNVSIGVTLGLLLALILNTPNLAFKPFYRIILILPWAVPNYITALIWKGMFHKQFGVINQVIQMFGGEPIAWFDAWFTSFIAVVATNGWLSFPFMMVVALGALQSIPGDLYEAARVDGAGRWDQFRFVTLPSLKPALVPAVILSVVWTFNMFNIIYLVSQGEPAGATEILITDAYKIAFEQYRYGYAAAYSVVIFMILLVYGVWQNRVTKATEGI